MSGTNDGGRRQSNELVALDVEPSQPECKAEPGLLSWLTGTFVNSAIATAMRPPPDVQDVKELAACEAELKLRDWGMDASEAAQIFEHEWSEELDKSLASGKTEPSLKKALWRSFKGQFLLASLLKLAWGACVLTCVTYFVRALLAYIASRATDKERTSGEPTVSPSVGVGHAIGFLFCMMLQCLSMQQMTIVSARLGLRVQSAVSHAVYRKSLVYDRFGSEPVDIVSLVSKDCAKLGEACTTLQFLWSGAVEAMGIMGILLALVGKAALPGLGVILILVPVQYFVGMAIARARKRTVHAADKRVRLTDEVLRAIKLVKMYAWEDKFADGVAAERRKEDSIADAGGILKALNYAIVFVMPPTIALGIFGVHTLDKALEAGLAFTTLSLFNTLRVPLILLPKGIRAAVEADSSAERLCAFLLTPESGNLSLQISNTAHAPQQSPKGAEAAEGGGAGDAGKESLRGGGGGGVTVLKEDSLTSGERVPSASRPALGPTPPQSVTAPSPPQSGGGGIDVQKSGLVVGATGETSAKTGGGLDVSAKSGGGLYDASGKPLSRAAAKCEQQRGRIEMVKASFSYGKGSTLLRDISLQCAPGSLTIITGTVGSGKSNLLAAILRQMSCVTGRSTSAGSLSYVPQTSWCAHGTVRDNILFGKPWDERRYRQVLFACALERDMTLLADGDLTEIGERGMNLSGGQRQRIAIARAAYASADIVLLDSPLSAVDVYTMQHIFRNAITGLMKREGATILLVTHQVELLPEADTLVVMSEGAAVYVGAPTKNTISAFFPSHEHEMEEVDDALLSHLSLAHSDFGRVPSASQQHRGGGHAREGSGLSDFSEPCDAAAEVSLKSIILPAPASPALTSCAILAHGNLPTMEPSDLPPALSQRETSAPAALSGLWLHGQRSSCWPDAPSSAGSSTAGTVHADTTLTSRAAQPPSPSLRPLSASGTSVPPQFTCFTGTKVQTLTPSARSQRRGGGSHALGGHRSRSGGGSHAPDARGRALSVRGAMLSALGEGGDGAAGRRSLEVGDGAAGRGRQSLEGALGSVRDIANAKAELQLLVPGSTQYTAFCARRTAAQLMATRSKGSSVGGKATGNSYSILLWEIRWYIFFPVLCQFVVTQLVRIFSDIWVAVWVRKDYEYRGGMFAEDYWYKSVYAGYVAVFAVMLFIRGYVFYKPFVAAATRLHDKMFAALLRAPMSFFTLTPLGNVLASVSKDMDTITETLLEDMMIAIVYCCILGTTIGVVIKTVVEFAAIAGGLLVVSALVFRYYLPASYVLKARAGVASTAVSGHIAETIQGVAVVKAFKAEERYTSLNKSKLQEMQSAAFTLETLQMWLSVRQDLIACLMVFGTCMLCVLLDAELTPAAAGLAVSNSFQILLFLSLMVRTAAAAHGAISAVERVHRYGVLTPETDVSGDNSPILPEHWPAKGEVEFQNVVMSYLPAAPHVLKGVSFRCQAGEKVGIVGRTGAGKSSLVMAMFRLAEPFSCGCIRIDGVDISQLSLRDLRSHISIIPQEPVMFEGTLRSNLDPFEQYEDRKLLEALDKCLLRDLVEHNPLGLHQLVASMGQNYSLGQQQLVCLARALLNGSRLLVLDEATAALDSETDAKVQRVVRSAFAERTVMTIAHRLDSIIDSDRILVMDDGRVAEFDAPAELLRDEATIFAELCRQTGASSLEKLRAGAERHAEVLRALENEVGLAVMQRSCSKVGIADVDFRERLTTSASQDSQVSRDSSQLK